MPKFSEATSQEPERIPPAPTPDNDSEHEANVPDQRTRRAIEKERRAMGASAGKGSAQGLRSPNVIGYVPPAVTRTETMQIRAGDLVVDPDYNRDILPRWVDQIAANFNPDQLESLNVSKREFSDGRPPEYVVISGQHRLAATLKARGPDFLLTCLVYLGLTRKQEAELFVLFDEKKRNHAPYQRYRAHLFGGNPEVVDIDRIVKSCGLEMYTGLQNLRNDQIRGGVIKAVTTVQEIYRRNGPAFLERILAIHYMAWQDNEDGYTSPMLQGTSLLVRRFGVYSQWRDEALAQVLAEPMHNPLTLRQRAQGNAHGVSSTSLAQEVARLEHRYYNQNKKGYQRLPEWNATPAEILAQSEAAVLRSKSVGRERRATGDEQSA